MGRDSVCGSEGAGEACVELEVSVQRSTIYFCNEFQRTCLCVCSLLPEFQVMKVRLEYCAETIMLSPRKPQSDRSIERSLPLQGGIHGKEESVSEWKWLPRPKAGGRNSVQNRVVSDLE